MYRLIYERIGAYLRRTLVGFYVEEEKRFNEKVRSIFKLYKGHPKRFNEVFGSNFKNEIIPTKSLQIFKVCNID